MRAMLRSKEPDSYLLEKATTMRTVEKWYGRVLAAADELLARVRAG